MNEKHEKSEKTAEVLRSFWKIQRYFRKWAQESIASSDLSIPQFWILQMVHTGKVVPQKHLGERLMFPKSTVSTSIEGLVESGLLKRIIPEENRREVQLQLTEEGKQKVRLIHEDPNGIYQKMNHVLAQMSEERIDMILALQHQLYEAMIQEEGGDKRC
ncbi:MarR family transcriptional regulator [Bacillus sp. 165]|uniref:MarR family winged helix-turn-helix transcriptional regulator n=1 Tax=Bacillus sp. 165 TaxID=1529117 RepID=UPI001ADA0F8E|nr:MarR family transcriptional regulator [Bacillus sp. 165]MBO9130683.1 winged helix DNA-binding protein [Bacillus sp. 165]